MSKFIELLGIRFFAGVSTIDTINIIIGHKQDIGFNLYRPQSSGSIGGHIWITGAPGKDNGSAFLQVPYSPPSNEGFGHLVNTYS